MRCVLSVVLAISGFVATSGALAADRSTNISGPPDVDAIVAADLAKCIEYVRHGRNLCDYLRPVSGAHSKAWEDSAKRDQREGLFLTGLCEIHAIGCERNLAQGFRRCSRAADKSLPCAIGYVGLIHMRGMPGVAVDHDRALRLFLYAANANEPTSMRWLGSMHLRGIGVPQSDAEALRWLRKAADAGDTTAMVDIADAYR